MPRSIFKVAFVLYLVSLINAPTRAAQGAASSEPMEALIARIKPKPSEETWKMIPWLASLVDGQKMARELNRPMFVWISSEEPLERC
jgi:hypothetical protein